MLYNFIAMSRCKTYKKHEQNIKFVYPSFFYSFPSTPPILASPRHPASPSHIPTALTSTVLVSGALVSVLLEQTGRDKTTAEFWCWSALGSGKEVKTKNLILREEKLVINVLSTSCCVSDWRKVWRQDSSVGNTPSNITQNTTERRNVCFAR